MGEAAGTKGSFESKGRDIGALLKCHGLKVPAYEFMGKWIHANAFEHKYQLAGESRNLPPNIIAAQKKRLQLLISTGK